MHKKCLVRMFFHVMGDVLMNHDELGISKDAKKQFAELKANTKKSLIRDLCDVDMVLVDIKSAIWQDRIDTAAINMMIDKKYELKREGMKRLVEAFARLKTMLSEEQMKKLMRLCREQKHSPGSCHCS